MGFISTKVAAIVATGTLVTGVVAYTGTTQLDTITGFGEKLQAQVETLSEKLGLANKAVQQANDEASRNIGNANTIISKKNNRISDLESQVNQANADIENLKAELQQNVTTVEGKETTEVKAASVPAVVDNGTDAVNDKELTLTVIQHMDTATTRTIALSNPNMTPVKVTYTSNAQKNGVIEVPAGDTVYVDKNNSGEMITFTYKIGENTYTKLK